jgi:hypothetical protein
VIPSEEWCRIEAGVIQRVTALSTALCAYLLLKRWISVGGAHQAKPERLRNDMVDVNFAVFATYFDGFLTADRKITEIYLETDWVLKHVFVPPSAFPMESRATQR